MTAISRTKLISLTMIFLFVAIVGGVAGNWLWLYLNRYNEISGPNNLNVPAGNNQNIIIQDAKKVTVEQDSKVSETGRNLQTSLVGIFNKAPKAKNYYQLDQAIAQAVILTSDGWLVTDWHAALPTTASATAGYLAGFVAITYDKKVFSLDKAVMDGPAGLLFLHLQGAGNLPVKKIAARADLSIGQLLVAASWYDQFDLVYLSQINQLSSQVQASDRVSKEMNLTRPLNAPGKYLAIADLAGDIAGLFNQNGKLIMADYLITAQNSLLSKGKISRPSLGVNYLNLDNLAGYQPLYGALLTKTATAPAVVVGSPADKAGLKEGDVIIKIDNLALDQNNDLADVLANYQAGNKITISYLRNQKTMEVGVVLGEGK